jgi:hypothetical protein
MPNVYKPGLVQIRPQYNDGGIDTAENVLWAEGSFSSPLTLTQLTNIAAPFDSYWPAMWKVNAFDSSHYLGCIVTDWSSNTGLQYSTVGILTPVAGTGGTSPAGAQVAILMSLSDGTRYKGGHARIYIPAIAGNIMLTPSTLQASTVATLNTNYNAANTAMQGISGANGGPFNFMIYRFKTNAVKAAVVPIHAYGASITLATQRRRLRKVAHT